MENKKQITVFGATGKIGGTLLRLLSGAGIPATAVTRNITKAIELPFVDWVQADMNHKESLYPAIKAGGVVFLSSGMSENIVREQSHVIEVATEINAVHIVKLSSGAADIYSPLFIARAHAEIEEKLKASGVVGTILRPNGFMQNWLFGLAQGVKKERKIYEATGDGKRAYIDFRDIAEVAFSIVCAPERHGCHAYTLTGDEAINYKKLASILSMQMEEEVTYIPITAEQARKRMEEKNMPSWAIQSFLAYADDQRKGKTTFVSKDVREILNRPARTVKAFVKENLASFL